MTKTETKAVINTYTSECISIARAIGNGKITLEGAKGAWETLNSLMVMMPNPIYQEVIATEQYELLAVILEA